MKFLQSALPLTLWPSQRVEDDLDPIQKRHFSAVVLKTLKTLHQGYGLRTGQSQGFQGCHQADPQAMTNLRLIGSLHGLAASESSLSTGL